MVFFSLNIIQANCQLVVKGNNYIPDYAPFAVDKQGKLIRTKLQIRVCRLLKSKPIKVCLTKNKKYSRAYEITVLSNIYVHLLI